MQDHEQFKPEIDGYEDDFNRLMEIGKKVVENQTEPQYLFLSERLNGIEENWIALHQMYDDRDKVLKQDVEAQVGFFSLN